MITATHTTPSPREPSPSGTYSQSYRTSSPSRVSTAPTEVSSALSSPTFAVPMNTHEALLRRQQSDAAAAEMSKRLLKGWAMLADECPNGDCYGIPLLRAPRAGGDKDPRKVGQKLLFFFILRYRLPDLSGMCRLRRLLHR